MDVRCARVLWPRNQSLEIMSDLSRFLIVFALLLRLARAQLWINLARFQTVRSKHLIVDEAIEFDQVCSSSICRRVFLLFALRFAILLYGIRLKCLRHSSCGILDVCRFHELHGALQLRAGPIFEAFSFLKYLVDTPWYHSLHHTQFRTNYCLFMPFYDYIYGTVDMSTEKLYKNSLKGKEVIPDVVHLTHLTTLRSIYLLRIGLS
ncbi:hypothetical protein BHE74_00011119 [Ensete ventricosum]|nr:hypothetical protein BHE74_00011119 [Ensete ventricosum]